MTDSDRVSTDLEAASKLVKEIPGCASDVSKTIKDLQTRFENGEFNTEKGISFLDAKCHMMLEYLTNLVYVILKKVSGAKIENDPAIDRLVESRVVMEKMRPIDQRLNYQIQKLLKIAKTGNVNPKDPLNFRPNLDNFVGMGDDDEEEEESAHEDEVTKSNEAASGSNTAKKPEKTGVYVPPRIRAVYYDGGETQKSREEKMLEQAKKRALSSSILEELRREYDTGPELIKEYTDTRKQKIDKELKEREQYEEEYMTRLPLTKKQKHEAKRLTTMSSLGGLAKFGDISALDMTPETFQTQRRRSSKKFSSKKAKGKRKSFKGKKH